MLSPAGVVGGWSEVDHQIVYPRASDVDMPSRMNVMNGLLLMAILIPMIGLGIAYFTYGTYCKWHV